MLKNEIENKKKFGEIVRFIIVGPLAAATQYGTHLLLICWLQPLIANTTVYLVSFTSNYIASTRYTSRVESIIKRGVGFILSHIINFLLQSICLKIFLLLGLSKQIALISMSAICVPINPLLMYFFLHRKQGAIPYQALDAVCFHEKNCSCPQKKVP